MIIFKDNSWQMDGSFPDFDYTRYDKVYDEETSSFMLQEKEDYIEPDNPAAYIIPDNSPLTSLVMQYAPNMQIVTDEDGNVIDVIEYYPLEEIITRKCEEINNACSNTIKSGIDYNDEHYDLTDEDQINMLAWSSIAQTGSSVPYHSSGNPCREYTAEEFLGLVNAATQFKTYQLTYCNLLKRQVVNMTDIEEVKSVTYGVTQLNDTYQSIMVQVLGGKVNEETKEDSSSSQESASI